MAATSRTWAVVEAPARKDARGRCVVRLALTVDVALLDPSLDVMAWSAAHWPMVGFYAADRSGIGLGFRIFSMPKTRFLKLFGERCPDVDMSTQGQAARLVMSRSLENRLVNGLTP